MATDDTSAPTPAPATQQPATPATNDTPGSNLPARDPRVLERGAQGGDVEKRQR